MFDALKRFVENVFDLLCRNDRFVDSEEFFETFFTEWNGDDASIDFYRRIDRPDEDEPVFRLFGCPGDKGHPILAWLDWCQNSPNPYKWMRDIWPNETVFMKHINAFNKLRAEYRPDEAMNRFLRALPSWEKNAVIKYVLCNWKRKS